jgi:uncharacterized protein (TIGR02391 family)
VKHKLNPYLDKIDGFDDLSLKDQIKALCYFKAGKDNKEFNSADIKLLFETADLYVPKNIPQYFSILSNEGFLISTKQAYKLVRNAVINNPFLNKVNSFAKTKTTSLSEKDKKHMRALECFDNLDIHPEIKKVSRKLFVDKHYAQAILEAFKKINNMVKIKSGRTDLDGKNLMTTVFSKNNPVLRLKDLKTVTDFDQQEGYMHLFAGAIQGIRNPKAHDEIVQNNPFTTVKFLCFASVLAQKVEESLKI